MKVIEKREPNTKRKRCIYCESLLEYSKDDIKFYDSEYSARSYCYIKCPVCEYKTRLNNNEILSF